MLDVKTLMLVLAFATALSVSGLLVAALLNRQVRAIRYWTLGLAVLAAKQQGRNRTLNWERSLRLASIDSLS